MGAAFSVTCWCSDWSCWSVAAFFNLGQWLLMSFVMSSLGPLNALVALERREASTGGVAWLAVRVDPRMAGGLGFADWRTRLSCRPGRPRLSLRLLRLAPFVDDRQPPCLLFRSVPRCFLHPGSVRHVPGLPVLPAALSYARAQAKKRRRPSAGKEPGWHEGET